MRRLSTVLLAAVLVGTAFSQAPKYRFQIDPNRTYTDGNAKILLWTEGGFRGDFDAGRNPGGSRTAPGKSAEPQADLNAMVAAKPVWEIGYWGVLRSKGTFDLEVDLETQQVSLSNYVLDRVLNDPLTFRGACLLNNEEFQSFGPPADYGPQLQKFSVGAVRLDQFKIVQKPGARQGTVYSLQDGVYRVSVTFMADVILDAPELCQPQPLSFTLACSLVGDLRLGEAGATLSYPKGTGGDNLARDASFALDDFPAYLPGPDGERLRVKFRSAVTRFGLSINGEREFFAVGKPAESGKD